MTPLSLRGVVLPLFFISGLSSLILETVWVRMMVLVFGSTTFAVSTVLTAFMGGLALGGWVAGRQAERLDDPYRAIALYGLLELGIGVYALFLPAISAALPAIHGLLWGTSHSSYYTFSLLRFLLAAAVLLLPTVAMGATLPVLARFFCAGEPSPATGRQVGSLYAVNTFGAVAGVMLAGFVLLPRLGTRATNLTACLADLGLAAAALLIWWRARPRRGQPVTPAAAPVAAPDPPAALTAPASSRLLVRVALWSIGLSGALAMVYQVAWTRALSLIIGSSTYAFSLILVCFLFGLAAGAALYARRQASQPDQAGNLGLVHLMVALGALGGLLFLDRLPVVLLTVLQRVELSVGTLFAVQFLLAGLIILLPTLFMGMVFPAVISIVSREQRSAARTTGDVYAVNTLGSIIGSFAGGFILIPLIGLQRTLLAMITLGLLLAAVFGALALGRRLRLLLPLCAVTLLGLTLLAVQPWNLRLLTSGVFRLSRYSQLFEGQQAAGAPEADVDWTGLEDWIAAAQQQVPVRQVVDTSEEPTRGYEVVTFREGVTTTVSMTRSVDESLTDQACWVRHALLVNGKVDASLSALHALPEGGCAALARAQLEGPWLGVSPAGDTETQILSGLLPVALFDALHPPQSALVIGWGSGMTAGAALQAPLKRVVSVELEQEVVAAARAFEPYNHRPQANPRHELINEDGRNYLASTRESFDLIISEPSNPWIAGCGNLFTREFFAQVRSRLSEDGVFLQWLQAYEIAPDNAWSILGTLASVFPAVYVFSPAQARMDLLLVARPRQGKLDWSRMARQLQDLGVSRELATVNVLGPADLAARLLAGPQAVRRLTAKAAHNTDDNARIEFAAPKDLVNYQRYSSTAIRDALLQASGGLGKLWAAMPADAAADLCWARLRSGEVELAAAGQRAPGTAEIAHCRRTAQALLQAGLPDAEQVVGVVLVAESPLRAEALAASRLPAAERLRRLARVLRPASKDGSAPGTRAAYTLLGHTSAQLKEHYLAILFLTAALQGEEGALGLQARQLIEQMLVHQYLRTNNFQPALELGRRWEDPAQPAAAGGQPAPGVSVGQGRKQPVSQ